MAYTLSLSNGTSLLTSGLADGTIDTSATSLALVGKNYPGYGVFLNENFIHLLENFANSSAPAHALPGQIWYDSANKILKLNVAASAGASSAWKNLAGITNAANKAAITLTPNIGEIGRAHV